VSPDVHEAAAARLQAHDGRYTRARRALVEVLADSGRPLTVTEICAASPLAPSSVYRNLAVLEDAGLVHRLAGHHEFARFELAEELLGHHHHLACRACGSMTDVRLPAAVEAELSRSLTRLARQQEFAIDSHRLDVVGLCRSCAAAR
jgi:Fur family ferric uptake transcriptional regulator